MANKLSLLFCLIFMGSIEHSTGQNISNRQKIAIEEQIDSVFHGNIQAAELIDYDRLSRSVDDKYLAGFIVNGAYFTRYDSLISNLKERSQRIARQTITIRRKKITVLSESIVLLTASGDTNVEVNDGNTFTAKFFWSFVYEKSGNEWKVIQSHQSSLR